MVDFASKIKQLRGAKGLSQIQFAKKFSVSKSSVSAWETGERSPSHDVISMMADYFGVSVDYLYGREKQQTLPIDGLSQEAINAVNEFINLYRNAPHESVE